MIYMYNQGLGYKAKFGYKDMIEFRHRSCKLLQTLNSKFHVAPILEAAISSEETYGFFFKSCCY